MTVTPDTYGPPSLFSVAALYDAVKELAADFTLCASLQGVQDRQRLSTPVRDGDLAGVIECRSPEHLPLGSTFEDLFAALTGLIWSRPGDSATDPGAATCIFFDSMYTYAAVIDLNAPRSRLLASRLQRSGRGPQSP